MSGLEAAWALSVGRGPEVLQEVPLRRIVSEGIDGALLLSILLRSVRARSWGAEAGRIREVLEQGMRERELEPRFLEPMLAVHERVRKGG